jgi:tetraacyldisaccharide 4'-kinase
VKRLDAYWQDRNPLALVLTPVSWLFCGLVGLRRWLYRLGVLRAQHIARPVVVVGNLTVGGTGKTPLIIALVQALRTRGLHPGVVSRGYGGRARDWPQSVTGRSDPSRVGEEPVLIAARTGCPLQVGPDRPTAARALLAADPGVDVVLSDDGLQHYALARDVEILVLDGRRGLGNGLCLPAGPLRERSSRQRDVDITVINGADRAGAWRMDLEPRGLHNVADPQRRLALDGLEGRVHAVAGIGDPERFFLTLESLGLEIERHSFPDHHRFVPGDLDFGDGARIVMTEKDAIKCRQFDGAPQWWYLAVDTRIDERMADEILGLLRKRADG